MKPQFTIGLKRLTSSPHGSNRCDLTVYSQQCQVDNMMDHPKLDLSC